jgi:two-component system invasion response regulator UvrY
MSQKRILLVDDHELVRTGIRHLLENKSNMQVVAEANSGEEAILLAKKYKPHIVLMDLSMPGIGGLEASRKILQYDNNCKIIIVTIYDGDTYPQHLFKIGVSGYLSKGCSVDEMLHACKEVLLGRRYVSVQVAQQMATHFLGQDDNPFKRLSQREMQIMMMLMQGLKNKQIAQKLNLSPKTISTYHARLFEKLEVNNEIELIRLATHYGLIDSIM